MQPKVTSRHFLSEDPAPCKTRKRHWVASTSVSQNAWLPSGVFSHKENSCFQSTTVKHQNVGRLKRWLLVECFWYMVKPVKDICTIHNLNSTLQTPYFIDARNARWLIIPIIFSICVVQEVLYIRIIVPTLPVIFHSFITSSLHRNQTLPDSYESKPQLNKAIFS